MQSSKASSYASEATCPEKEQSAVQVELLDDLGPNALPPHLLPHNHRDHRVEKRPAVTRGALVKEPPVPLPRYNPDCHLLQLPAVAETQCRLDLKTGELQCDHKSEPVAECRLVPHCPHSAQMRTRLADRRRRALEGRLNVVRY